MSEDNQAHDKFTRKSLLLRVEKTNKRHPKVFLKEVCGQDVLAFGTEGSTTRRQMQLFWNNLKRQLIWSYVRHLELYGISNGEGTRRELQEEGTAPSPSSTPSDLFEEEKAEETANDTAAEKISATEAGRNQQDDILSIVDKGYSRLSRSLNFALTCSYLLRQVNP
jgi:hypothetical protein